MCMQACVLGFGYWVYDPVLTWRYILHTRVNTLALHTSIHLCIFIHVIFFSCIKDSLVYCDSNVLFFESFVSLYFTLEVNLTVFFDFSIYSTFMKLKSVIVISQITLAGIMTRSHSWVKLTSGILHWCLGIADRKTTETNPNPFGIVLTRSRKKTTCWKRPQWPRNAVTSSKSLIITASSSTVVSKEDFFFFLTKVLSENTNHRIVPFGQSSKTQLMFQMMHNLFYRVK